MQLPFDFSQVDPSSVTDNFIKKLKESKQSNSSELFQNLYSEALDKEESKQKNIQPSTEGLTERKLEKRNDNEQKSSLRADHEDKSHGDESVYIQEETKILQNINLSQFNLHISQLIPKDFKSIVKQVAELVYYNPDSDSFEFKAKEIDVNIKFLRQDSNNVKITLLIGDLDIQETLTKPVIDEMQKALKSVLKEDLELIVSDQSDSILFSSNGNNQEGDQARDESESNDDSLDDADD